MNPLEELINEVKEIRESNISVSLTEPEIAAKLGSKYEDTPEMRNLMLGRFYGCVLSQIIPGMKHMPENSYAIEHVALGANDFLKYYFTDDEFSSLKFTDRRKIAFQHVVLYSFLRGFFDGKEDKNYGLKKKLLLTVMPQKYISGRINISNI